jgi:hypothetical protein
MGMNTDFENMAKKMQEYTSAKEHLDTIPGLAKQLEDILSQACIELEEEMDMIKNMNS